MSELRDIAMAAGSAAGYRATRDGGLTAFADGYETGFAAGRETTFGPLSEMEEALLDTASWIQRALQAEARLALRGRQL